LISKAHDVLFKGVKDHPELTPGLGLLDKSKFLEVYTNCCLAGKFCFYGSEDGDQGDQKQMTENF
jgi:hypothetical protein